MANDLIKHGCIEHKTNLVKPPYKLNPSLRRHFIRGYLDANGCIAITRGKTKDSFCIKFTGTDELLIWIMNCLKEEKIINRDYPFYKREKGQIVSSFEFGGNNLSYKFLNYIYSDSTIWLDRKYERFLTLQSLI